MGELDFPLTGPGAFELKAPPARRGMRIGLLGGSFDPPHGGHLHISQEAMKRLRLDQLWWLVSPGNPLKPDGPWPLGKRLRQCRELAGDEPRIRICAPEALTASPYSIDLLRQLRRKHPAVSFIWLMGADNLAGFHRWRKWRAIASLMPMAVIDRPASRYRALSSRAGRRLAPYRLGERESRSLARRKPPAWALLSVPLNHESSSAVRARHS
jgi:nicotinate-nucleotide adenylyltransferase